MIALLSVNLCGVALKQHRSPAVYPLTATVAWSSKWPVQLCTQTCCDSSSLLHIQQRGCLQADAHPLFVRVSDEELAADPAACLLDKATEEGQKVARNSGLVSIC